MPSNYRRIYIIAIVFGLIISCLILDVIVYSLFNISLPFPNSDFVNILSGFLIYIGMPIIIYIIYKINLRGVNQAIVIVFSILWIIAVILFIKALINN